jgi:ribulose-5-phosphate 4-epimerase/fuculose-1-phosphate aldolase
MSKLFETLDRLESDSNGASASSWTLVQEREVTATPAPLPSPVATQESLPVPPPVTIIDRIPPTAKPFHRMVAEAFDASMVVLALAIFTGIFLLSGAGLALAREYAFFFAGVLAVLAIFYRFLWVLANLDTPGAQIARLRVVDLDPSADPAAATENRDARQMIVQTRVSLNVSRPEGRALLEELALAYRILSAEGVVDGYGHVSVRDDRNPRRYFLVRRPPGATAMAAEIVEYDLDSKPVSGDSSGDCVERFIHGEIYRARADVMAVVHSHAPEVLPFAASNVPLLPISHMAAFLGEGVPVFEIRESAGTTDMMIRTAALGRALAETLGDKPAALLRGHGSAVVGSSLHEVVGRSYYMNLNARLQQQAIQLGGRVTYLEAGEAREAAPKEGYENAWDFWKQKVVNSAAA